MGCRSEGGQGTWLRQLGSGGVGSWSSSKAGVSSCSIACSRIHRRTTQPNPRASLPRKIPSLHHSGLTASCAELPAALPSSEFSGSSYRAVPMCILVEKQHQLRGFASTTPYLTGGQQRRRKNYGIFSSELSNTAVERLLEFAREPAPSEQGQLISGLQSAELARSDLEEGNRRTKIPFNIIFVTAEVAPYSKTGGLGDVCGSLPIALAARGHRVMVISPRYMNGVTDAKFAGAFDTQCRIKIGCFEAEHEVAFFHEFRAGVDWVFVDHPSYHRPGTPYGDTRGAFDDNQFRFTLLCHAACEAPLVLPLGGFTYGEKCIFVANDWHAGLVPVLLAAKYRRFRVYKDARSILAIHNLAHQGVEPATTYSKLGLPGDWYGALEWVFPTWARKHALDKGEAVNHLKGAIVTSDRIVTVSQGYAWEVTTVEGGWGLDGLLRSRIAVINGITNGVDVDDWNPMTDKHIAAQYTLDDLSGKAECKAALQKELGLAVRPEVPLVGFIGRLDYQKGPDVIQAALPEFMQDDVQMVMLGSGDPQIESWMKWAEATYKDKFRGWVGFSVPVAHRITAGCDILLMPSRFEPCGLNQLYGMRYGTVPVVHSTGGLRDTVEDFNPFANAGKGGGTGWTFSPLSKEAMLGALWTSIQTYREHKASWQGIMRRGMEQDVSWDRAALQYEQIFEWSSIDPPYA
ncbi:hypothetical protein GOP47_0012746 [Adiantum capillus-veneris]|uniref:Starch synthase, chloroplastic/amyloplastic n=1 Tax=Adiantum capillus-veneris TaxID=13818 RepID=A0A9D4ZGS4_ADICA|nr:hypothetical protein GOP47_0012746 [Adiantum capillus-veneris]